MNECVLAADLGGTKIRTAAFMAGEAHFVSDRPTDLSAGRDGVMAALRAAIADCREQASTNGWAPVAVGVSCAGVIDPQQGLVVDATAAIPGWKGTRVAELLEQELGLPVAVENDVKAALLGELCRSPVYREGTTVMLALGTGLGGAIAIDGEILSGASQVAGHFGRTRLPSPWQSGKTLALEDLVSGTGLANIANHLAGANSFDNGRDVLSALRRGEAPGRAACERFCDFLLLALENIYWSLNPDRVLIGGGLVAAREDWWHLLEQKQAAAGLPLLLEPAGLGNDAGIYGAAALAHTHANTGVV
ncbi:N-acetyl-D-glucosamine kinase [Microbulbifer aggregans]|uniref:N-acetyl-D-glucosamine kinase n=1 Tax=Microbulbifer aggregans TaxID=1769779 RepID=A0A1C9W5S3_9GAMM|nr:ROK family protein [Microbulbifer aggregans]AOS96505.1 N-acetyl-D-glucosamine kinase [Microbulbifer aggregans]